MVPYVGYHSYMEDTGVEVNRTGQDQVELDGRADSRDGRTRRASITTRRSSSPVEPTRVTAKLAGELTDVMVELAGELTRVIVQLSGEWLLCGIRSFVHFRSFFQ
ncbi:hypothetical protein HID58_047861 [Brassica napus]|uniref:Uncharacterized protein n=1 Tax=Brassica napus TaxID=3708 RepID=A0ABQ8B0N2_BRANA|nr:hypothetical protein HID58_047861 [Brassica napus]